MSKSNEQSGKYIRQREDGVSNTAEAKRSHLEYGIYRSARIEYNEGKANVRGEAGEVIRGQITHVTVLLEILVFILGAMHW